MARTHNIYRNEATGEYWLTEFPQGGGSYTGVAGPLSAAEAYPDLTGEWDTFPTHGPAFRRDAASIQAVLDHVADGTLRLV